MGIIITVILAISAAVSIGAQGSLPGEPLYPIKTEVNEKIEHWFAFSEQAEAELSAKLARRRLEEAMELKTDGKLDADTKALLESEFKAEAQNTDPATQAKLENSIRASGNILEVNISGETETRVDTNTTLRKNVKTDFGSLYLTHENGKIILSGSLERATPCIEWDIKTTISKDKPPSNVVFELTKRSTAEVCIQILGKPQEIKVESPASATAEITVNIQAKAVFSGKMN